MAIFIDALAGESASLDFKSSFDPHSKQDWCELIKDVVAMSNSGGGSIVVGLDDDGDLSNSDIRPLLAVDPADVTNKIYSYTDQHFAAFEIVEGLCCGKPVAVIKVEASRIPIVFTAHGGYAAPGGQKAAFVKGSVYFRHGAKSEPGTTDDLRQALERELEQVKGFWLDGIRKVTAAPAGSSVQIVQRAITLKDTAEAAPVRLTTDEGAPPLGLENVVLRDTPGATAIRLTNNENAPTLSVMQADKLYPYRQKEVLNRLSERLGGQSPVNGHDLQCVRRAHNVDDDPMFSYQAQHSPRKYTEAYVDWLVNKRAEDPNFFQHAREAVRGRNTGGQSRS
jgi:Schlafen, AlbA_2